MALSFNKYLWVTTLLSLIHASIQAQEPSGERRVYYLDATYSMVSNKLWEPCKDNLINAIENVDDVNTELAVIIFADNKNSSDRVWNKWEVKATDDGKKQLIEKIKCLPPPIRTSMTNLYDPLMDFYSETKPDKINYMFLMTDGGHEQGGNFNNAIDQWSSRTNLYTYGFFVELTENVGPGEIAARDTARTHIDKQTKKSGRIWRVSSANANINLIRLDQNVTFNIRNDSYIDIPIHLSGDSKVSTKNLSLKMEDESDMRISNIDITNNNVRAYIKHNIDIHNYPTQGTAFINVSLSGDRERIFLLTNKIRINCLNKKEKALSLSKNMIHGKVKHYDSFAWQKADTSPFESSIDLHFSQDALCDSSTFVEFVAIDNEGIKLLPSSLIITINGHTIDNNIIHLSSKDNVMNLTLSFPEGTKNGTHQGYLKVGQHRLDRIDNQQLNNSNEVCAITWRVKYVQTMNPLAKTLMWIIFTISAIILFWFIVIKPAKYPCFPKFRKMILIKKDEKIISQFTVDFKGARKVVFSTRRIKQSILSKIFTGRIDTIVNPIFEEIITFIPRKGKRAMAKGNGYLFNPNPTAQSGTTVITHPINKITINLQ